MNIHLHIKQLHIHIDESHCTHHRPKPWLVSEVFFINQSIKTKGELTMVQAKIQQVFTATWPGPKDKAGNEASVQDGSVAFSSDDESVATVEANPDGGPYSAKVTTGDKVGATTVKISADADLGEGVKTIEGLLTVEVRAGDAVGFTEPTNTDPVDV